MVSPTTAFGSLVNDGVACSPSHQPAASVLPIIPPGLDSVFHIAHKLLHLANHSSQGSFQFVLQLRVVLRQQAVTAEDRQVLEHATGVVGVAAGKLGLWTCGVEGQAMWLERREERAHTVETTRHARICRNIIRGAEAQEGERNGEEGERRKQ